MSSTSVTRRRSSNPGFSRLKPRSWVTLTGIRSSSLLCGTRTRATAFLWPRNPGMCTIGPLLPSLWQRASRVTSLCGPMLGIYRVKLPLSCQRYGPATQDVSWSAKVVWLVLRRRKQIRGLCWNRAFGITGISKNGLRRQRRKLYCNYGYISGRTQRAVCL